MPYDVKRFIFSVSLCAILAVNPVLATAPGETESVGTAHTVYDVTKLNKATNGIAGVGYVNRMVDAAGNAATAAEAHAAAAGAHALSAAQSADEAHEVLADKVSIDQGADNKYKAMVTDDEGSVYAGYIDTDMIASGAVTAGKIAKGAVTLDKIANRAVVPGNMFSSGESAGVALVADGNNSAKWGQVGSAGIANYAVGYPKIADGAVAESKIANGAVTADKISGGAVTFDKIAAEKYEQPQSSAGTDGVLLTWSISGDTNQLRWRKIQSTDINNGAVTIEKTAGVVGMVPVGSADATTYGQFWIE